MGVQGVQAAADIGMGLPGGVLPTDVAVPLPESETPMIRKNKALREDQSRRSSLGMRGQRASTSLGRGELSRSPLCSDSWDNLCRPHVQLAQ